MTSARLTSRLATLRPVAFVESNLAFDLYFTGSSYFEAVLKAIEEAKVEVFIESYIFEYDHIGQKVLLALHAAALRGVTVRLLVDGVGSMASIPQIADFCALCGIPFEVYHAMPFHKRVSHNSLLMTQEAIRRRLALLGEINKRNHRKIILIDGVIAFLGSLNISDVHIGTTSTPAWRDTGLRIEGSEVSLIRREMDQTWLRVIRFWTRVKRESKLPPWLRLNSRLRWRRTMKRDLLAYLANAKKRIYITTPYFVPSPRFLKFLERAAHRGVDVHLLLPEQIDVPIIKYVSRAFYRDLMNRGIKIWEYQPSVLHAKTMVIDDYALIGSQNLNHRSFLHDLEIEVATGQVKVVNELLTQWDIDLRESHYADLTVKRLGLMDRILSWIFILFKYWL
jgi:cardiolipin synthase